MRLLVLVLVIGGCTDEITFGDVEAIDAGDGRIQLRACLDEEGFSCKGGDVVLDAAHAGESSALKYGGFFAMHHGSLPLVDRGAPIVITNRAARATMELPAAFELAADVASLGAGGEVTLTWDGAGEPMIWVVTSKHGGALGDEIDDDGKLVLTARHLRELISEPDLPADVTIEVSRVRRGSIAGDFHADDATGITRRSIALQLD